MTTLNIKLPDKVTAALNDEIARGRHANVSTYLRKLILADRRRREREELEAKLAEGLKGPAKEMTSQDWVELRQEVARRIGGQRTARRKRSGT